MRQFLLDVRRFTPSQQTEFLSRRRAALRRWCLLIDTVTAATGAIGLSAAASAPSTSTAPASTTAAAAVALRHHLPHVRKKVTHCVRAAELRHWILLVGSDVFEVVSLQCVPFAPFAGLHFTSDACREHWNIEDLSVGSRKIEGLSLESVGCNQSSHFKSQNSVSGVSVEDAENAL